MNEKEVRRLSKTELIELLIYQSKQIDELKGRIEQFENEHVKKEDVPTKEDIFNIVNTCISDKTDILKNDITGFIENLNISGEADKALFISEAQTESYIDKKTNEIKEELNSKADDLFYKLVSEIDRKYKDIQSDIYSKTKNNIFRR